MNAPTLRDVAAKSGVSVATASYALRHDRKISAATRKRVMVAAETLGYTPDTLTRSLVQRRWDKGRGSGVREAIAVVFEDPSQEGLNITNELREQARRRGYNLLRLNLADFENEASLARLVEARGIRGLVIYQGANACSWAGFPWEKFAAVSCNETFAHHPIDVVRPNHFEALVMCWEKVWERGFRRIGLVLPSPPPGLTRLDQRYTAAFVNLQHQRLPPDQRLPILTYPLCGPFPADWWREYRPEVVIGMADHVRNHMEKAGCFAPRDLRYVSLSASPLWDSAGCNNCHQRLFTVALDILDRKLIHGDMGPTDAPLVTVVPATWKEGVTLGHPAS